MSLGQIMRSYVSGNHLLASFFLGAIYSIIGIFSAKMVFGSNPDMMSIAFISLLLIPAINRILLVEENLEAKEEKFSFKGLFTNHKNVFLVYIYIFFGVFFTYLLFSMFSSESNIFYLFESQLKVAGITGNAINIGFFSELFTNNLKVLIACLILSLIYGAGSILFITWNASVWGAVFGYSIKMGASVQGQSPWITFLVIMLPVFPHLFIEALSYFFAAISGGVVSKAISREEFFSSRFTRVLTDGLFLFGIAIILVIIGALVESRF